MSVFPGRDSEVRTSFCASFLPPEGGGRRTSGGGGAALPSAAERAGVEGAVWTATDGWKDGD